MWKLKNVIGNTILKSGDIDCKKPTIVKLVRCSSTLTVQCSVFKNVHCLIPKRIKELWVLEFGLVPAVFVNVTVLHTTQPFWWTSWHGFGRSRSWWCWRPWPTLRTSWNREHIVGHNCHGRNKLLVMIVLGGKLATTFNECPMIIVVIKHVGKLIRWLVTPWIDQSESSILSCDMLSANQRTALLNIVRFIDWFNLLLNAF